MMAVGIDAPAAEVEEAPAAPELAADALPEVDDTPAAAEADEAASEALCRTELF